MIRKKLIIIIPWTLGIIMVACCVVFYFVLNTSDVAILKNLYFGNKALEAKDYKSALDWYVAAYNEDTDNKEIQNHIVYLVNVAKTNMPSNQYEVFINEAVTICSEKNLLIEKENIIYNSIMNDINNCNYDDAISKLSSFDFENDMEANEMLTNIYLDNMKSAVEKNDYVTAYNDVIQIYGLDINYDDYKDNILVVVEAYIEWCNQNGLFVDAIKAIELARTYFGDDIFESLYQKIYVENEKYQLLVSKLDEYVDVMKNDQYNESRIKECIVEINKIEGIHNQVCSSSLSMKDDDDSSTELDGKGAVLSWIDGNMILFFGTYDEGIRRGECVYTVVQSENFIDEYRGNWVNGIPDGELEIRRSINISDLPENTNFEEKITGYVSNGVYEGQWKFYCDAKYLLEPYEYYLSYVNGYCTKILYNDLPKDVKESMVDKVAVSDYYYLVYPVEKTTKKGTEIVNAEIPRYHIWQPIQARMQGYHYLYEQSRYEPLQIEINK